MMNQVRNINGRINGLDISGMTIHERIDGVRYFSVSFYEISDDYSTLDNFEIGIPMIGLADGFICHHCQGYTPRGNSLCMHCAMPLDRAGPIRMFPFPFVIYRMDINDELYDFRTINLSMRSRVELPCGFMETIAAGDLKICRAQEYSGITEGVYLCPYCGKPTAGEQCGFCGEQMPRPILEERQHHKKR